MLGLLNVVKGRLEASDTIFELIKDVQDNCVMKIHRVNDEIMVNRALNVYKWDLEQKKDTILFKLLYIECQTDVKLLF